MHLSFGAYFLHSSLAICFVLSGFDISYLSFRFSNSMASAPPHVPLIVSIFKECQETSLSHDRLIASLTDLYMKVNLKYYMML